MIVIINDLNGESIYSKRADYLQLEMSCDMLMVIGSSLILIQCSIPRQLAF